jgi:hypothetical protein
MKFIRQVLNGEKKLLK